MREWLRRDLRRDVPRMGQVPETKSNWASYSESGSSDDVFSECERLRKERDFWRCRCGQLPDAISDARSIADEWDEEA